jgi:hypothetical protein
LALARNSAVEEGFAGGEFAALDEFVGFVGLFDAAGAADDR